MFGISGDNLKKRYIVVHANTESKYSELAHEILSFFKLSIEALDNA